MKSSHFFHNFNWNWICLKDEYAFGMMLFIKGLYVVRHKQRCDVTIFTVDIQCCVYVCVCIIDNNNLLCIVCLVIIAINYRMACKWMLLYYNVLILKYNLSMLLWKWCFSLCICYKNCIIMKLIDRYINNWECLLNSNIQNQLWLNIINL